MYIMNMIMNTTMRLSWRLYRSEILYSLLAVYM